TLALGIGATTAIFSVVYSVLLKPLPYADPNRIVAVFEIQPNGRHSRLADPNFDDFRDQSHSFYAMAKYTAYPAAVSGGSAPTCHLARCTRSSACGYLSCSYVESGPAHDGLRSPLRSITMLMVAVITSSVSLWTLPRASPVAGLFLFPDLPFFFWNRIEIRYR